MLAIGWDVWTEKTLETHPHVQSMPKQSSIEWNKDRE